MVSLCDVCFLQVVSRYTWKIYSERLMPLSGVYGIWKYVLKLEMRETTSYLEMLYILKFPELLRVNLDTFLRSPGTAQVNGWTEFEHVSVWNMVIRDKERSEAFFSFEVDTLLTGFFILFMQVKSVLGQMRHTLTVPCSVPRSWWAVLCLCLWENTSAHPRGEDKGNKI